MKVVIAAGMWPPDVAAQAVYASALAEHLQGAGHEVAVVTRTGSGAQGYTVHGLPRRLPRLTHPVALGWLVARRGYAADVVYDVGLLGEATVGAGIVHRPLVVKLAGDPAFARGRRFGLVDRDEEPLWGARGLVLRGACTAALRRASRVVCSSPWLTDTARSWGLPEERLTMIPNPAPRLHALRPRDELRHSFGFNGPIVAFAGRITPAARVDRMVEALTHTARVELVLAGGGPGTRLLRDLAAERGVAARVHVLGALSHARVLELFHAADLAFQPAIAGVFPNAALEALAVGRPVLTTVAPGSPALVREGENGLVVDPAEPSALANAIDRYLDDAELRARLERGATASALPYAPERIYAQLEHVLADAAQESA